jgi:hypothetical protein
MYIDDLAEMLSKEKGIKIYLYADDLAILGIGLDPIKKVIKLIEKWTEDNKMAVNKSKSGVMIISGRKLKEAEDDVLGYPYVNSYKYLGVLFN